MKLAVLKTSSDLPKSAEGFDYAYLNDQSEYWKNEGGKWLKHEVKTEVIKTTIPKVEKEKGMEDFEVEEEREEVETKSTANFELPPFMDARFESGVEGQPLSAVAKGFDAVTKESYTRFVHKASDNGHTITLFGY